MALFGKKQRFSDEDDQRLVRALRRAEEGNTGEVRIHVEDRCPFDDPVERAQEVFDGLGMHQTDDETGVLLYVADKDRVAAIYAGEGIYSSPPEEDFWQSVIDEVRDGFRDGRPVEGLIDATERIGELLREHVPGRDAAGNELPEEVTEGDV